MKTLLPVTLFIIFAFLITAFTSNRANSNEQSAPESDFIIITYNSYATNNKATVLIQYGGTKHEEIQLTKEQIGNTIGNNVIDLLTKFNSQGYTLVSTTGAGVNHINCFLKKQR